MRYTCAWLTLRRDEGLYINFDADEANIMPNMVWYLIPENVTPQSGHSTVWKNVENSTLTDLTTPPPYGRKCGIFFLKNNQVEKTWSKMALNAF